MKNYKAMISYHKKQLTFEIVILALVLYLTSSLSSITAIIIGTITVLILLSIIFNKIMLIRYINHLRIISEFIITLNDFMTENSENTSPEYLEMIETLKDIEAKFNK